MTAPQESSESNTPVEREVEAPESGDGHGQQFAETQQQVDTLRDALQRERADFLNYRHRVTQERDDLSQRVRANAFHSLLPALDDLERALQQIPPDGTREPWVEGFRLVGRKLLTLLDQAGVTRIGAAGEPFDPHSHEAVAQRPPAHPGEAASSVGEVVRPGYRLGGQVLRPAQVIVVSDAGPPAEEKTGASSTP